MTYLERLGASKNKDGSLDCHEGLRDNRAQARIIDKVHFLHETTLSRLREVVVLSIAQKPTQCQGRQKKQKNMFQTKEQDKSTGTDLNETEITRFT